MATIQITDYSDPSCPFAWSAEPSRRRIDWLYGDGLTSHPRMVGLHSSGEEMERDGLTAEKLAATQAKLARSHHMPMQTIPRERLAGSVTACHAVVAVRLHAPERERAVLRALRVLNFSGQQLDDPETLREAARRASLDPDALRGWLAEPAGEQALAADMAAARRPSPEALALPGKLASTDDGGYRYTCPSWELARGEQTVSVAGFQPLAAYEVAIANLAPELARREDPTDVSEVLDWAGEPLATAEIAAVCAIGVDDARERLGQVATEEHVGFDGLWSLQLIRPRR
jgi:predicted DsbA family dithiol-disulfide isomerase